MPYYKRSPKNEAPYAIGRLSVVSVLSCLSVTLVHCAQTVGWIKMKLGKEVGLGPGHIVLDGPPKGHSPNFWSMTIVARGVATGGYIGIYTLPKSVSENYFVH